MEDIGTKSAAAGAGAAAATPPAEELLKKIQELEEGHAHLKQEMSKLMISAAEEKSERQQQRSHSISPQRSRGPRRLGSGGAGDFDGGIVAAWKKGSASFRHSSPLRRESRSKDAYAGGGDGGGGGSGLAAVRFTDKQYLNILQSMGQSVHIFDLNRRIIYWNRSAEHLYGYSAAEALGQDPVELLADAQDYAIADNIIELVAMGQSWTGQFPVKNKKGERFVIVATDTPFYDDDGTLVGIICVSADSRPFQETKAALSGARQPEANSSFSRRKMLASAKLGLDPQQPLQVAIASKISNLVSL